MTDSTPVPGRDDTDDNKDSGLRARFRAIRDDDDVKAIMGEAKPFVAGAALVGGLAVDAPATIAYTVLRTGRAVQKRRHRQKIEAEATPEV